MKKIIMIITIATLLVTSIGCSAQSGTKSTEVKPSNGSATSTSPSSEDNNLTAVSVNNNGETDNSSTNNEDYYVSPTDQYAEDDVITIGRIIKFDGQKIHILGGDLVEIYEYDGQSENFYLGQEVKLVKHKKGNTLVNFIKEDYTISHTKMGDIIYQVTGEILDITKDTIKILTNEGETEVKYYNENASYEKGTKVTIYYISYDQVEKSALMVLNEDSKITLTVTELSKDDAGNLTALLIDKNAGVYTENLSNAACEFNIADVQVGDELIIYQNGIMESDPMQIDTVLIRK